jgi:hypothetical protein
MPVTMCVSSIICRSLSRLLIAMNVPSSIGGNTLCSAAVASRTTEMSVGLPRPERSRIADTILRYRLSRSSLVLARESVISRITGCSRDSSTRRCSSRNSARLV